MFWRFVQPDSNDRVKESRKNKAMDTVNILNSTLHRSAPQIMLFFSPTTICVIAVFSSYINLKRLRNSEEIRMQNQCHIGA